MKRMGFGLWMAAIAIVLLPLAAIAQTPQDFIRSENIIADVITEGVLTETTRVDGAGIFENGVTYVYSAEKGIRTGVNQGSRVSKVQYDPETGEYLIQSNGADVWDNEDAAYYMWTTRPGSYRMTARVRWIKPGGHEWAKAGIMSRTMPDYEDSPHFFFQFRGNEDLVEPGFRSLQAGATTQRTIDTGGHQTTVFLGPNSHEPIWLRYTRIWPSNQIILEDANDDLANPDNPEIWEWVNNQYAAFGFPYEMNWGIFGFDHEASPTAPPDEALIDFVTLEPIVGGNRIFPNKAHFTPGEPLSVTLLLDNPGDDATASVVENVPDGWTIGNVSNGGSVSANSISWSVNVSGSHTLSYTVTPPAGATSGSFSGTVNGIMTAGPRIAGVIAANEGGIGDFDGISWLGDSSGSVSEDDGNFSIASSGAETATADNGAFVWKLVSGPFSIEVDESELWAGSRLGLMVRDDLSAHSSYTSIMQQTGWDGLEIRTRSVSGNNAFGQQGTVWYPGTTIRNVGTVGAANNEFGGLRLSRDENGVIVAEFKDFGNPDTWTTFGAGYIVAQDPVYVGLAVFGSTAVPGAEGEFNGVAITGDVVQVQDWTLY